MPIQPSELILNEDGSVYHLNLLPDDIANTIITVGDPDRVESITKYFDSIEVSKHKREFFTQTGYYKGKHLTVISTGIGTDNIDIVFNELDALVNINLQTREINSELKSLNFIRIGTSGAIQPEIPVDSFLVSEMAIGFDSLMHYYQLENSKKENELISSLITQLNLNDSLGHPYVVSCSDELKEKFDDADFRRGITVTNVGFYGPQGRKLRLKLKDELLHNKIKKFSFEESKITNLEMETAGIYGMSRVLGHQAISLNAILANRATGKFSEMPNKTVDKLIKMTLQILVK